MLSVRVHDDPSQRRRLPMPAPLAGLVVTLLVLGGVVALSPSAEMSTVRRLVGLAPDRFAEPPAYTPGQGSFLFSATQAGSDEPVGFDPCRAIEYVINPQDGPDNWKDLIQTAADHTSWATGLRFEYAGTTDHRPFVTSPRVTFGGRAPVVIGWASEEEIPELAGDVAGLGGSTRVSSPTGRDYLVTGAVALDVADFEGGPVGLGGELRQAIVDHEFGHLVGLAHSPEPTELMFAQQLGRISYGPGDLEGLARLGSIPCG